MSTLNGRKKLLSCKGENENETVKGLLRQLRGVYVRRTPSAIADSIGPRS